MDKKEAYHRGMDYAKNKANTYNCHFEIFSTIELKEAWEKGIHDQNIIDIHEHKDNQGGIKHGN